MIGGEKSLLHILELLVQLQVESDKIMAFVRGHAHERSGGARLRGVPTVLEAVAVDAA